LKRVVLYRFDRPPVEAIVSPADYMREGRIELITVGGNLQSMPFTDVKALCFASEPGRYDLFTDQNLFERRPKMAGLWTRFVFRDGDRLDGLLAHNLADWPESGYLITPPKSGAARQRVFIPRQAISETIFCGIVGAAHPEGADRKRKANSIQADQLRMFDR
jgi:hypothetical protein